MKTRKIVVLVGCALVLSLAGLAACSGDDVKTPVTAAPDATPKPAPGDAPIPAQTIQVSASPVTVDIPRGASRELLVLVNRAVVSEAPVQAGTIAITFEGLTDGLTVDDAEIADGKKQITTSFHASATAALGSSVAVTVTATSVTDKAVTSSAKIFLNVKPAADGGDGG